MDFGFISGIYCGPPPTPEAIWASWNFDPVLLCALSGFGIAAWRDRAALAALAVLILVFVSPLCALSSALFSARVVHHILLTALAAPLLALWRPAKRPTPLAQPLLLATLIFWAWHVPLLYDAALGDKALYWVMELTLLGSATWFWRAVMAPGRSVVEVVSASILVFAQMGLLGALLTFAPAPVYASHALAPLSWGLSSLADQQLGGLLMWVPSAFPVALAASLAARRAWRADRVAE